MTRVKQALRYKIVLITLIWVLINWMIYPQPAWAQSKNPITNFIERLKLAISPKPKPVPTGRSRGGGGRGPGCPAVDRSVTALVPTTQATLAKSQGKVAVPITVEKVGGVTIEQQPVFWFYVPYFSAQIPVLAEFMLLDEDQRPVLTQPMQITLPKQPGIIRVSLSYALETGKSYNWYFSIVCDALKPSKNPGVSGWIQRIEPSDQLRKQLNQVEPLQKYTIYADNGIWYETLTQLAENHHRNPQNNQLQQDWMALLKFLDLESLASRPIVDCCTPKP